jgi:hypothetical protein
MNKKKVLIVASCDFWFCGLGSLQLVELGSVADVSEIYIASIFRFEVNRTFQSITSTMKMVAEYISETLVTVPISTLCKGPKTYSARMLGDSQQRAEKLSGVT